MKGSSFTVVAMVLDKSQNTLVPGVDVFKVSCEPKTLKLWMNKIRAVSLRKSEQLIFEGDEKRDQLAVSDIVKKMSGVKFFNPSPELSQLSAWRQKVALRAMNEAEPALHPRMISLPRDMTDFRIHSTTGHNSNGALAMSCFFSEEISEILLLKPGSRRETLHRLPYSSGISGMATLDWYDSIMLAACAEGSTLLWQLPRLEEHILRKNSIVSEKYFNVNGDCCSQVNAAVVELMQTPERFLTVQGGSFHLWSFEDIHKPSFSSKVSNQTLNAAAWDPHDPHRFAVGGHDLALYLFDSRTLSSATKIGDSICWSMKNAARASIQVVSFSPLLANVLATGGDDGCVNIWDLRKTERPVNSMFHLNGVTTVEWSTSHVEMLATGSIDSTMKIWNLRLNPKFIYSQTFAATVAGVCWDCTRPLKCFGCSTEGEVLSLTLDKSFCFDFVPHRSDDENVRGVERLLYMRDLAAGSEKLVSEIDRLYKKEDWESSKKLLNSISSHSFGQTINKGSLNTIIKNAAYFLPPPPAPVASKITKNILEHLDILEHRYNLRKHMQQKAWQKILKREEKIFEILGGEFADLLAPEFLGQILTTIKPSANSKAYCWGYRLAKRALEIGQYEKWLPPILSVLSPTVYDEEDLPVKKITGLLGLKPNHSQNAGNLFTILTNPRKILAQLDLLNRMHSQIESASDPADQIIEMMEKNVSLHLGSPSILPQAIHINYFDALLKKRKCEKFFILCSSLEEELGECKFSENLVGLKNSAVSQLRASLDEYLSSKEIEQLILGSLTIINIIVECPKLFMSLRELFVLKLPKLRSSLQRRVSTPFNYTGSAFQQIDYLLSSRKLSLINQRTFGEELDVFRDMITSIKEMST